MSKKPAVVKTYGRHRYRTVKAQTWLSPDEAFCSPFGTQTRFPSKIEPAPSRKVFKPKSSQWSKPAKKIANCQEKPRSVQNELIRCQALDSPIAADCSDKENQPIRLADDGINDRDTSDRRQKRKRQNLFSPLSGQRGQKGFDSSNLKKTEVVLVNDTLESKDDSSCQIVGEFVCVQDSKEYSLSPDCRSNKASDATCSKWNIADSGLHTSQSLDWHPNVVLHSSLSSPKDSAANVLENGNCLCSKTNTSVFDRCQSSYNTSTPVFNVNSPPAIIHRLSKSNSQSSMLMDGKIILEPLRITPIQWKNCLPSSNEKSRSKNSIHLPSDVDQNSGGRKSSSMSSGHNSSVELKECVVSLEKLRITPLKKKIKCHMGGIHLTGDSRGKSQLSFVEALTPAKKSNKPKWNADDSELELSAFDKVMMECDQEGPVKFTDFLDSSLLKSCVKIGEGVYGEVFQAQYESGESIALKIIPVEGDFVINGEPQKSFQEILPEIVISKELSLLGANGNEKDQSQSFITVHSVTCCRDKYPKHLISEWDKWNRKHTSENDRPDIFPSDQYFIVFEFSNGGRDLESFEFDAMTEAWSVLQQTALGLAVAENALEFEHRDLHWGNVLICRTEDEFIESCLFGETKTVPTHGVRVSLIDFTLSRLKKDGVTVFCNLAEDESLFTGKGDYQFDVYRLMKKSNQNDWEPFEPHTNALWLHYLADKMLKKKKYPSKDKETEAKFKRFLRQARKCSSATEIVQDFFD